MGDCCKLQNYALVYEPAVLEAGVFITRAVNNLAVNALTCAFARNTSIVDEKAARIAIPETGAD